MEYQEAFYAIRKAPWNTKKRIEYGSSRSFYRIPKKQFWNTRYSLWKPKKLEGFLEYQEAFMQYQEAYMECKEGPQSRMPRSFYGIPRSLFMEHSEAFMECQETLPPISYQEATTDIKKLLSGIQRSNYGTPNKFYGIPRSYSGFWNAKLVWNVKKLRCNTKRLFMEYKDGLWNTRRLFGNTEKLSCNTKKP